MLVPSVLNFFSLFFMFVWYMCSCLLACIFTSMWAGVYVERYMYMEALMSGLILNYSSPYSLSQNLELTSMATSPSQFTPESLSPPSKAGITGLPPRLGVCMGSGDLNSDLHACWPNQNLPLPIRIYFQGRSSFSTRSTATWMPFRTNHQHRIS